MVSPVKQPTPERVMQVCHGYQAAQLLRCGVEFGYFTLMANGIGDATALARAAGTDRRATRMVLDGLLSLGLLEGGQGHYRLSPDAAEFLVESKPGYLGDFARLSLSVDYERWSHLPEVVKSGEPLAAFNRPEEGTSFFVQLVRGLHSMFLLRARELAQALRADGLVPAGARVLDVGAGSGVWSLPYLKGDPAATVTAVDMAPVLELTREYAVQEKVAERLSVMPGDFFEQTYPPEQFDLAILGNICHQESPESNQRLLRLLHPAIKPGGHLVVVDMIPNEERSGPPPSVIFALTMLMNTSEGNTYTLSQYQDWFIVAGFRKARLIELPGHVSPILVARKG